MCLLPGVAIAEKITATPATVTVAQRSAEDETTYYLVTVSFPRGLTSVSHARLEFRVDVSARDVNGFVDSAPILDVYALNQVLSGDPDISKFEAARIPMSRPVASGANRLIRIDVTEYVQGILVDPSKNNGIVLGPLTADKRGIFHINENGFGEGVGAQIVIVE
jgi:hypothetical protein